MAEKNAEFEIVDDIPQQVKPIPKGQMASVINIPPQIAVTVCWVALGFGIAWWLLERRDGRQRVNRGS